MNWKEFLNPQKEKIRLFVLVTLIFYSVPYIFEEQLSLIYPVSSIIVFFLVPGTILRFLFGVGSFFHITVLEMGITLLGYLLYLAGLLIYAINFIYWYIVSCWIYYKIKK